MNPDVARIISARERGDEHAEALARAESDAAANASADRILARGKNREAGQ